MDYYGIAFCAQMYQAEKCPDLGPFDIAKYFYNILFVVFLQMSLLMLACLDLSEHNNITQAHFYILTARFICAVLLHIHIEPEVF